MKPSSIRGIVCVVISVRQQLTFLVQSGVSTLLPVHSCHDSSSFDICSTSVVCDSLQEVTYYIQFVRIGMQKHAFLGIWENSLCPSGPSKLLIEWLQLRMASWHPKCLNPICLPARTFPTSIKVSLISPWPLYSRSITRAVCLSTPEEHFRWHFSLPNTTSIFHMIKCRVTSTFHVFNQTHVLARISMYLFNRIPRCRNNREVLQSLITRSITVGQKVMFDKKYHGQNGFILTVVFSCWHKMLIFRTHGVYPCDPSKLLDDWPTKYTVVILQQVAWCTFPTVLLEFGSFTVRKHEQSIHPWHIGSLLPWEGTVPQVTWHQISLWPVGKGTGGIQDRTQDKGG